MHMSREEFSFSSSDGLEIAYYRWRAPARAAGIVQIAHGMGEHALRYAHVAEFLNQAGYHVYASDHRGHGRTAKNVEALGDSMGSFAAQQYVLDNSALIAGLVLSGSAAVDKLAIDPSREADLTAFNRSFEPARTQHDWLSRDPAAVDAYEADPLCGFGINKKAMESMTAS